MGAGVAWPARRLPTLPLRTMPDVFGLRFRFTEYSTHEKRNCQTGSPLQRSTAGRALQRSRPLLRLQRAKKGGRLVQRGRNVCGSRAARRRARLQVVLRKHRQHVALKQVRCALHKPRVQVVKRRCAALAGQRQRTLNCGATAQSRKRSFNSSYSGTLRVVRARSARRFSRHLAAAA